MKSRIYTKTGDQGETSLIGGSRVMKSHMRLFAYGSVDELNSVLGLVIAHLPSESPSSFNAAVVARLKQIQNSLFNVGSVLACEDDKLRDRLPPMNPQIAADLEADMDQWDSELSPLKEFILPGGSVAAAFSHQARTVCRRAEREVVRLQESGTIIQDLHLLFLNRLSDWLFVLARRFNKEAGLSDQTWLK